MDFRKDFRETSPLDLWHERIASFLGEMKNHSLCDNFTSQNVYEPECWGYSFRIKGPHSEIRYKYKGVKPGNSYRAGRKLNIGVVEARRQAPDFYIHLRQHGSNLSPTIILTASGKGLIVEQDLTDDNSFSNFETVATAFFQDREKAFKAAADHLIKRFDLLDNQRQVQGKSSLRFET